MNKKALGVMIVVFAAFLLSGCAPDSADSQEVAEIVSKTQTAMAEQEKKEKTAPPVEITEPPPTQAPTQPPPPEPTDPPPPPPDRCTHFNPDQNTFVLHSIEWGDEVFVMYVKLPGDVPGYTMQIEGDKEPWLYSGEIGDLESIGCRVFEGDIYQGRIYCLYPIEEENYNTARPFELKVNGCESPIVSHPILSLIVPETEEDVKSPACGLKPGTGCSESYAAWCDCRGLKYYCLEYPRWAITTPSCWPPLQ